MADSDLKQLEIKLPEWKNLLNERKMAYFDFLKNSKDAETYSTWRDNNPPLIPKKFQSKPIPGETNEQRQGRITMATDQMKCEKKIMKIKANSYKKKFESIDNQMFQNIKEKFNGTKTRLRRQNFAGKKLATKKWRSPGNFGQKERTGIKNKSCE